VDIDGKPVDCSSATVSFVCKQFLEDTTSKFTKANSSTAWDKTRAADGIFILNLSSADLNLPQGKYLGEFSMALGPTITKSELIDFWINPSLS
jgi:hypothetical protein